jgi:uncharacterized protein (DUF2062 family)
LSRGRKALKISDDVERSWLAVERCLLLNLIRLLRIRGQSERVARGFALGLVVNFFQPSVLACWCRDSWPSAGWQWGCRSGGRATLSFFWPALFYLNMRTGSLFVQPPVAIDGLEDVTEKTVKALVWGQTFTAGAVVNSLIAG